MGIHYAASAPSSILVECKTLRHVVALSAEAEVAGVFHNAQVAIPLRHILSSLGHPQPITNIMTDNSTVAAFANNSITQKCSKLWDTRFYWFRDKQRARQFTIT